MGDVTRFTQGYSLLRLADEFRMDRKTVKKRIQEAGVAPSGQRAGNPIYLLADVAPFLVDPWAAGAAGQDPRDLPPIERRAFYQSENERLKVEVSIGALVPAAEIEVDYAALVKLVAQFIDTLPDVLERDCALKPEDLVRVQKSCDRVRQRMYEAIVSDETTEEQA